MGLVLLTLLYAALAAVVALAAIRLAGPARRPGLAAALVLSLVPLAFTAGGFQPGRSLVPTGLLAGVTPWAEPWRVEAMEAEGRPNPLLLDPVSQFIPWREAARSDWLFNPSQGAGAALLANGQSAVLFPTEALARLLPPFRAATFSQAARLLLAMWGFFLLARALALSERAALLAASAYAGAGFVQLWRLHPHSLVAATAPWILFALVELARRPDRRRAVLLAVCGAVGLFAGHPETLLHVVVFGLGLLGIVLWWERSPEPAAARDEAAAGGRRVGRVVLWGVAAACLSVLLAAPLLLPFVENLVVSWTWVERRDAGTVVEVPLAEALERLRPALVPTVFGEAGAGWRGPENLVELAGGAVGSVALLLAALALADRRRRALVVGLLALGTVGLAVSIHLPWISWPFGEVPLLRESLLKRLSLWWLTAMALAAGIGFDRWLAASSGPDGGRVRWRIGVLAATAGVGAALWWADPGSFADPVALWAEWVPLALAAAILGVAPAGRPGRVAAVLLFAALLVPRVGVFARWVPADSAVGFYPETEGIHFVAERLRAEGSGYRVAGLDAALVPQAAAFFGFPEARSNDPMTFAPFDDFSALTGEPSTATWNRVLDPARPALAFLGVRWIFDHPSMGERPGVEIAWAGADAVVYENRAALPRAWVPREVDVWREPGEALAAAAGIEDFAGRVAVSGEGLRALGGSRAPRGGGGPVRLSNGPAEVAALEVAGRRVTARVAATGPALLATSQPAIPGWRASLDGEPADPVLVHGAFLGLVVPPGDHAVELVYAPRSWTVGLVLGALGVVLGAAMLRRPRRGRRSRRAARRRGALRGP